MLRNKYFRVIVFAALVPVIYYNLQYMRDQFGGPASQASPHNSAPSADTGQKAIESPSDGPSVPLRTGPAVSLEYLERIHSADWGRNPFFTERELNQESVPLPQLEEAGEAPPPEQPPELQLQMVVLSEHGNVALINGQLYRVGDQLAGGQIDEIRRQEVVVKTANGLEILKLNRSPMHVERESGTVPTKPVTWW